MYGELSLADRIYIFCSEYEKGIEFYDQSPYGAVAELTGSLPEGQFWSSGENEVSWDNSVNGERTEEPVTSNLSIVVNQQKVLTHDGSYTATMDRLVKQIQAEQPAMSPDGNYKVINFGTKLVNNKAKNNSADSIDSMYLNNYDDMNKDEIKDPNDLNDFHI